MVDEIELDLSKADQALKEVKARRVTARQTQGQLLPLLAKEIGELTKHIWFAGPDGSKRRMAVYEQLLPLREDEEEPELFPYCVVKFSRSSLQNVSEREDVDILLDFGIYYDASDRQYQYIMFHIFNLVKKRFLADNFLENYRCEPEMTFALSPDDEATYPYYFGAIGMRWKIPGIDREVDFWN